MMVSEPFSFLELLYPACYEHLCALKSDFLSVSVTGPAARRCGLGGEEAVNAYRAFFSDAIPGP